MTLTGLRPSNIQAQRSAVPSASPGLDACRHPLCAGPGSPAPCALHVHYLIHAPKRQGRVLSISQVGKQS